MSPSILLLILAVVFFVLAAFNVTANGKVRFEWLAFACITAAWLLGMK